MSVKNNKITPELIQTVKNLLKEGKSESEVRVYIREQTSTRRSQGNKIFREIISKIISGDSGDDKLVIDEKPGDWGQELEFNGDVVYNKEQDVYVMFLKKLNKNIVLKGEIFRDIQRSYSDLLGEPSTINELARAHGIPRYVLSEIIRTTGLTHSDLPFTDTEIEDKNVDEVSADILELKKFKIVQEFNKKDWQSTQKDATKWREFEGNIYNPFTRFVDNWNPPEYKKVKLENKNIGSKVWLSSISDIHVGLIANARYNYFKGGWSHADLESAIKQYANKIRQEVDDRKSGFESAYLLFLGDICHGLYGFTDKGTKLEVGAMAEEQFDLAFSLLSYFINELLTIFPTINVKSVVGNHSSFGDYVVAFTLSKFYHTEPRITFDIVTQRYITFKIKDYLFAADHGYSAFFKSRLPETGVKRENYINKIFLSKPELLQGIKQKYFLTADQHHFETKEYGFAEHYMFSTLVGGDRHSDNCGYNNRPRQNCLVVDEDGVKEIISVYFD